MATAGKNLKATCNEGGRVSICHGILAKEEVVIQRLIAGRSAKVFTNRAERVCNIKIAWKKNIGDDVLCDVFTGGGGKLRRTLRWTKYSI